MIYTLTPNPCIDYYMEPGGKPVIGAIQRTQGETLAPGGKGINVAIVLARLGQPACAWGFAAGRVGAMLESLLEEEGCRCGFTYLKTGETRINVKLTGPYETAFNAKGPAPDAEAVSRLLKQAEALTAHDTLVLSGNVQAGLRPAYDRLMELAKRIGARLVVDAEGEALLAALPHRPDLIKPNREELSALVGRALPDLDAVFAAAEEVQALGAQSVLVSLGGDGAALLWKDGCRFTAKTAAQGTVVSTVGAGDSMVAGFLYGLETEKEPPAALKWAAACGTATAFSPILTGKDKVLEILSQISVQ